MNADIKKLIERLKDFHAHLFNQSNPERKYDRKTDEQLAYLYCAEDLEAIINEAEGVDKELKK